MRPFVEEMQLLGKEGITINDTYFKRDYITRWFLATVSADTPARNHLGDGGLEERGVVVGFEGGSTSSRSHERDA